MSFLPPVVTPGLDPELDPAPRSRWARFLRALSPRAIALTLISSLVVAVVMNPIFELPFMVLLGRTLFVGFITLIARSAVSQWRQRLVPPWVLQSMTVSLAAMGATLAVYLLATGGDFGAEGKGDIPARRRELQRDHVNRLATVLLRTPGGVRVDLRSTLRSEAAALLPRIQEIGRAHV